MTYPKNSISSIASRRRRFDVLSVFAFLLLPTSILANSPAKLADAAEEKDQSAITSLIEAGADVNAAQVDGMTALHWAVYHDNTETARRLLQAGADVQAKNRYGVTPLSLASTNGNAEIVELLLENGADPNTALPGGETPLMTAARTGKLDPVKVLLKAGARVNDVEHNQQTAIMWAAADGHAKVVRELIDAKADFQTPLPSGFTPFFFAVRAGHIDVVKTLLKAGVDVQEAMRPVKRVRKGVTPGTSALSLAVENGHFELAKYLLEQGADPNDLRSGYAPLHRLTWVRKPNRGDGEDGDPPPQGSGKLSSLDFVRLLVKHGADVNLQLKRGRAGRGRLNQRKATPFLMAADTADLALMKLLVELGADPLKPNIDGCTPLMAAAGIGTYAPGEEAGTEEEAVAAVEYLLELGADINTVDKNGETAMHGAAYKNLPKMVKLLAENGADVKIWNKKNKYGWTPLLIAQGHRPGNFKPSAETVAAIKKAMRAAGVNPPEKTTPRKKRQGYEEKNQGRD